jgi:hypothetical protein
MGALFLVVGLFVQMQPFPLLGWLVSDSEIYLPLRSLLNQIYPAWAAFAILLRLEPQFTSLGLFPAFGWFALASTVLLIFSGLFQNKWRITLGAWISAGFSLTIAVLAFSGPLPAMAILLGVSLGGLSISGSGAAFESDVTASAIHRKRAIWVKIALFLAAASGTGVIGFVAATGGIRWILNGTSVPAIVTVFVFTLFMFIMLGWKLAWNVARLKSVSDMPWLSILSLFIWIILSLGIVWTGSATGEVFIGLSDQFMSSLFQEFFGKQTSDVLNHPDFISAAGLYWGTLIFAIATAFWTSGRKEDRWANLANWMPKTSRYLSHGYGIDSAVRRFAGMLVWLGNTAENLIDQKIWSDWIPHGLFETVKKVSDFTSAADFQITTAIGATLKRIVEVPAKLLQLIQTGDLRWYLIFALGSGFALLTHFLKI